MRSNRPTRSHNALGAVVLGLVFLPARPSAANPPATLDFVYIDATAGEASGGHTALRLGEAVFHYEIHPGGLLLLSREPWEAFLHRYNDQQNRSVTVTRVPVDGKAYERVRSHLFGRYVQQQDRLLRLDRLAETHALLRRLADGQDRVALPGLGFFSEQRREAPSAIALRRLVERRFGDAWLLAEQRAVTVELEGASLVESLPAEQFATFAVRLKELLSLRQALSLLLEATGLSDDALLSALGNGGPLTERERASGERFLSELADSVLALLASNRPDRGTALLVQMARHQAVSRSLSTGVLATLDPFSDGAERLPPSATRFWDQEGERLIAGARGELARCREAFAAATALRATAYSRVEAAQGRLFELARARRFSTARRVEAGHLLPGKSRAVRTGIKGTPEQFAVAARVAGRTLEASREEVAEAFRYHLITRNCVTEIVRDVNASFASREQARARLGGVLVPGERLSFIPFRLTSAIAAAYASSETEVLPSFRLRQLNRLYEQSGPLVWLRESNTWTSTLYSPEAAREDGVFLFFTDDLVTPRPLLGSINLLYAATHAACGCLLAPVDEGRLLTRSLRGMLYSLPEIAFFNIRKGSFQSAPAGSR